MLPLQTHLRLDKLLCQGQTFGMQSSMSVSKLCLECGGMVLGSKEFGSHFNFYG